MAEPVIRNLPLPEVGVEDVLRAEGNDGQHPPRQSIVDLYEDVLAESTTLVEPRAIWTEVEVEGAGRNELRLKGGLRLTSRLLVKCAGSAEKLLIFVMTIGAKIDEQISLYQQSGNISRAYVLDSVGSTFIALGSSMALSGMEKKCLELGLKTSIPLGPGHSYWKRIEDQQVLFRIAQPERIGLSLNDSNLMLPRKSVSMVMGVGNDLPEHNGQKHCDFCTLRGNCPMNKVVSGAKMG